MHAHAALGAYDPAMSHANAIWNRALEYGVDLTRPGDRHLRTAVTFDGSAENGGLLSAVESHLEDEEFPLAHVVSGLQYFGLTRTAALVVDARDRLRDANDSVLEELELTLDPRYPVDGEDLSGALEDKLATDPEDFAPLG